MAEFRRFECDCCNQKIPENARLFNVTFGERTPRLKVDNSYGYPVVGDGPQWPPDTSYDLCESCFKGVLTEWKLRRGLFS